MVWLPKINPCSKTMALATSAIATPALPSSSSPSLPSAHCCRCGSLSSRTGLKCYSFRSQFRLKDENLSPISRKYLQQWRCYSDGTISNGASSGNGSTPSGSRSIAKTRREMLLEYVGNVQPEFMELFIKRAPPQVVEAMRQTVTNMLGTLPPQFFEITVTTVAENLAQLMYSVMMTGYMFRNAQYRLELQQSLNQAALPDANTSRLGTDHERGSQKSHVNGNVLRWHKEEGPKEMDAAEYIELLETEIAELEKEVEQSRKSSRGQNELLQYLKSLEPQNLQELTMSAGEDAVEAMNTFIQRLLGVTEATVLKRAATETTAKELAKMLYWIMIVGYSIRNIEVRHDMERVLGMPVKLAELPPGEAI